MCVCVCVCERERERERECTPLVVSDCLRPCGLEPSKLVYPWDFPGKNTAVGCHALLQGIFPIWGSNLCLLHLHQQAGSSPPAQSGKPSACSFTFSPVFRTSFASALSCLESLCATPRLVGFRMEDTKHSSIRLFTVNLQLHARLRICCKVWWLRQ